MKDEQFESVMQRLENHGGRYARLAQKLRARDTAQREALALALDAATKGDDARAQCGGMEIHELRETLRRVGADRDTATRLLVRQVDKLASMKAERDAFKAESAELAASIELEDASNHYREQQLKAQLAEAAHLMQETERVLRIGDGYGWEDRLANNLVAFLARYAQVENELCIDEGCSNHGTAQGTLKNTGRFSEEGDSRTDPDGTISTLVDNGDGSLGVTTTKCPKLHPLYLDHVNGCITGKNPAQGEQSGDDEQPECFCVKHELQIETLKAQLAEMRRIVAGFLFSYDDGVGKPWERPLLDYARKLVDAKEFVAVGAQAEQHPPRVSAGQIKALNESQMVLDDLAVKREARLKRLGIAPAEQDRKTTTQLCEVLSMTSGGDKVDEAFKDMLHPLFLIGVHGNEAEKRLAEKIARLIFAYEQREVPPAVGEIARIKLPAKCPEKTFGENPFRTNYAVGWDDCLEAVWALNIPIYAVRDTEHEY